MFIGITGVDVEIYERQLGIDLNADEGVIIIEVSPNSPASSAGLMSGDIIEKIDDQNIESMSQLKKVLYKYNKGDSATLNIIRNGSKKKIEIKFSELKQ